MAVLTAPESRTLYQARFPLMGGEAEVKFVDVRGQDAATTLMQAAVAEARRIEAKFSRYRPTSVISEINTEAGGAPVIIDDETEGLVRAALDLAVLTEGRFDPTVGVLRRVWDFRKGVVPAEKAIQALLPCVDAGAVELRCGTVRLARRGMELDLGGVGKEYAADRVAELLRAGGAESALVNLLGDVRTVGSRGDRKPWVIGVQDPRDRDRFRLAIRAKGDCGIATSGDYERGFEVEGIRYHHLLDATTGHPARGLASVTVVAPTAFEAGRLSTATFLLGPQRGLHLLESSTSVEGALITEAGELLTTTGLARIATFA
ncbi:MAG: FAD:protein FMN transferase [Geothrix sp.]|uniref:FAD:protein FMN transferase n=1 Tax=Geothrix sp. TaxID=1962974 RepID=UPI0017EF32D7|nr:FAD:protein FMN transferase [Geothrix sp.]NWJ41812.1 FAD:protein FMN transferase [Geothrix sp.]WIL20210.1 MAG: FAD:protein FMN transferase [Geothrix sp.]